MDFKEITKNLHPSRAGWNPDLTDLDPNQLETVKQVSLFLDDFLRRADNQKQCLVRIDNGVSFDMKTGDFGDNVTFEMYMKYLKGIYSNKERFIARWIENEEAKSDYFTLMKDFGINFMEDLKVRMLNAWDETVPFTYQEAFSIADSSFRSLVFGTISITEMMGELDGTCISSAEIVTKQNKYVDPEFTPVTTELINKYEVWEADGTKLGVDSKLYAVKCFCTTTGNTHYLWLSDSTHKDSPLEAIASTFFFYEELIPHIEEIYRQGDTWFPVLAKNEEVDAIIERLDKNSKTVPLTADIYFSKIVSQS